jgi:predicted dehydrogenase
MSQTQDTFNRRDFMVKSAAVAGALGAAKGLLAKPSKAAASNKVIGANDRINVGVIGVGGRGSYLAHQFELIGEKTNACKVVAVADVYEKRKRRAAELRKCDGYLDYHEVINRPDVDAVVVATPDHWHAPIALEAMDHGKDVYLEKPMCHTIEEAKHLVATVKEGKRVLQVGSQTTSALQWHTAKKYIADGAIGKMIMSQGSYHRNSADGEWNWDIDADAGPDGQGENFIDWKMWLGKAPKRPFDADRFFRFRKYWDY